MAAVDNIDYNPSAATAEDSFHGTGISLMQHPFHEFEGNNQSVLIIDQTTSGKAIASLPQKYASVLSNSKSGNGLKSNGKLSEK